MDNTDLEALLNIASRDVVNGWGRVPLSDIKSDKDYYNMTGYDLRDLIHELIDKGYETHIWPPFLFIKLAPTTSKWAKERQKFPTPEEPQDIEEQEIPEES